MKLTGRMGGGEKENLFYFPMGQLIHYEQLNAAGRFVSPFGTPSVLTVSVAAETDEASFLFSIEMFGSNWLSILLGLIVTLIV